jgi:chromosome segregation ATPase
VNKIVNSLFRPEMDFFKEVNKAYTLDLDERLSHLNNVVAQLKSKDELYIKNILDGLTEELEIMREENEESQERRKEISKEIEELVQQKQYLAEAAMGADTSTFKEIQSAISGINKQIEDLNKEVSDLQPIEDDNEVDKQMMSAFNDNYGNKNSLIDFWAFTLYKVKVLLSDRLLNS